MHLGQLLAPYCTCPFSCVVQSLHPCKQDRAVGLVVHTVLRLLCEGLTRCELQDGRMLVQLLGGNYLLGQPGLQSSRSHVILGLTQAAADSQLLHRGLHLSLTQPLTVVAGGGDLLLTQQLLVNPYLWQLLTSYAVVASIA